MLKAVKIQDPPKYPTVIQLVNTVPHVQLMRGTWRIHSFASSLKAEKLLAENHRNRVHEPDFNLLIEPHIKCK